jgi:predicted nucleic acid-binding protein
MTGVRAEGILPDTSVWVRYFRPKGDEDLKREVAQALATAEVFTCWVVKAELLVGAKDDQAFELLRSRLGALREIELVPEIWTQAARLGRQLRHQGFTVPLADLVVAQCAIAAGLELWHADTHFEHVRRVVPLRTRAFCL